MRLFVGVDQALQKTGVCVIRDEDTEIACDFHLIRPPRNMKGSERLTCIRDELWAILNQHIEHVNTQTQGTKHGITRAAIEAQSLGSLGDIDQLGQINGVVQVLLTDLGAPPLKVPPTTLKKFVTGHGYADKDHMRRATLDHWGIDITQNDLCDAHGLAQFAREACLQHASLRHQIEAVFSVLKSKKKRPRIKKLFKNTL